MGGRASYSAASRSESGDGGSSRQFVAMAATATTVARPKMPPTAQATTFSVLRTSSSQENPKIDALQSTPDNICQSTREFRGESVKYRLQTLGAGMLVASLGWAPPAEAHHGFGNFAMN